MNPNEVARRMKILRAALGLSQSQLGDLLGRSKATIGRWEGGKPPDDFVLAELAARAGFGRTYFIEDELVIPSTADCVAWREGYDSLNSQSSGNGGGLEVEVESELQSGEQHAETEDSKENESEREAGSGA